MTTTIDTNQRIFVLVRDNGKIELCNLNQIESRISTIKSENNYVVSFKHIWNGKIERISKKLLNEMLELSNSNFKIK